MLSVEEGHSRIAVTRRSRRAPLRTTLIVSHCEVSFGEGRVCAVVQVMGRGLRNQGRHQGARNRASPAMNSIGVTE